MLKKNKLGDQLIAWRTEGKYWGKKRTVIVSYNPLTVTKQRYSFPKKLLRLQGQLLIFQTKVNTQAPHGKNKATVVHPYKELCSELHIPTDFYTAEVSDYGESLNMIFRKNHYRIGRYLDRFGKNIIVTDSMDWTTDEIVKASLDRWIVEDSFCQ
ncbi:MAG: hypothetical protein CSA33_00370 [Desulfobulbus propionicus]|nr:MAG: hypothetical protein CSA33_00370 [Desulfobulbus propionicus]